MLCYTYNQTPPNQYEKRVQLLDALLGSHGKNVWIEAPFRCDYGSNIHVGENFYANYDCIFLDVAPITIGSGVMLAPARRHLHRRTPGASRNAQFRLGIWPSGTHWG